MPDIDRLRETIDRIDSTIRTLYAERIEAVAGVARFKQETGGSVYDPAREMRILAALTNLEQKGGLDGISRVYETVMRTSREYQYRRLLSSGTASLPWDIKDNVQKPAVVYYQGVDGSYSSQAARLLYPDIPRRALPTFSAVTEAVRADARAVGVLPIDNTTEGAVSETHDLILRTDVHIVRSVAIPASHCLAGVPGASVSDVRRVFSHPQALAQCGAYLRALGVEAVPVSNTAVAARDVAAAGDPACAALASPEAARLYGLCVLADGVQDIAHNTTRFVALSGTLAAPPEADHVSLVIQLPHESGTLAAALALFSDYGLSLTKIQSRPLPDSRWHYSFYLDFEGRLSDPAVQALLYQLYCECQYIKLLGFYNVVEVDA